MRSHIINMNKNNNNSSTDKKKLNKKNHIHSISEKERMSLSFDDDSDDDCDQSDDAARPHSKGRRSKRRCSNITTSSSVSELDQLEQEEVAMSLMMLSRDVSNWGRLNSVAAESSDNSSELILINLNNNKKKKNKIDSNWMMNELSCSKRSKFECTTCNKIFHSYQALGGHRASHKKTKGCFASTSSKEDQNSIDDTQGYQQAEEKKIMNHVIVTRSHECPICLRVFSSGQALGGHKRSHLLNETGENHTVLIPKPIPGIREFLDLNMPAPLEDQEGFNPWWVGSSSHKHETLVGLI